MKIVQRIEIIVKLFIFITENVFKSFNANKQKIKIYVYDEKLRCSET